MSDFRCYRVGGHLFTLDIRSTDSVSDLELQNYAPFRTTEEIDSDLLFTLTVTDRLDNHNTENERTVCFDDENGRMELSFLQSGKLRVKLWSSSGKLCSEMVIDCGYRSASAVISDTPELKRYALDSSLMMLYSFASAAHQTILIHASAIEYNGRGYLFLGKSGTGKSTHSQLWIENISGSSLLNDDNPILRITDGTCKVYGSPWSGKTPCYLNQSVRAGAIVRLSQGPVNKIKPLSSFAAYGALLPACSFIRWDHSMAESIHCTLSHIIENVHIFSMECRPDQDAAILCKETVMA